MLSTFKYKTKCSLDMNKVIFLLQIFMIVRSVKSLTRSFSLSSLKPNAETVNEQQPGPRSRNWRDPETQGVHQQLVHQLQGI